MLENKAEIACNLQAYVSADELLQNALNAAHISAPKQIEMYKQWIQIGDFDALLPVFFQRIDCIV